MRYVIDASVAARWFLKKEEHPNADAVLARMLIDPSLFAAPELFAFEVFTVLRRVHLKNAVLLDGFLPLLSTGLLRYPMTEELLTKSIYYCDMGLTSYDATYVALAEILNGAWLTFDTKAHNTISGSNRSILLSKELPTF